MLINAKILSIPPYISTSWKNVASLHMEGNEETPLLIVTFFSGVQIAIPGLAQNILEAIFTAHMRSMQSDERPPANPLSLFPAPVPMPAKHEQLFSMKLPFKMPAMGLETFGQMGGLLEHNQEESNAPNLPEDILLRIGEIARSIGIDDPNAIPKPEPHCNCMHCQIAKALQRGIQPVDAHSEEEGEPVSDEDLKFRMWDIAQTGDKLYSVSNPLDSQEHYSVFLGDPLGCTCGQKHCEHIRAVLDT